MKQGHVDEALTALYLRLNGYFTTGLIIHSPTHGQASTDIDCLAVRLPHHRQDDRQVAEAKFLGVEPNLTDLIVCEVKSIPEVLAFNEPVRTSVEVLAGMLRWAGALADEKVQSVAERLQPLLADGVPSDVARKGIVEDGVRVRALLCCPLHSLDEENRWCLNGEEILRYADECFNPEQARPTCSVRYNFQQWSYPLSQIVVWLKSEKTPRPPTLAALYAHLGVTGPQD